MILQVIQCSILNEILDRICTGSWVKILLESCRILNRILDRILQDLGLRSCKDPIVSLTRS